MSITDKELTKQINRMIDLCKFAGKSDEAVETRTLEYSRLLRAGVRNDFALGSIVDDLIEHCEEIPTPAQMVDTIRRHNEAAAARKSDTALGERYAQWQEQYGDPEPFKLSDCCECGKPWKQIHAQTKRNYELIGTFIRNGHADKVQRYRFKIYPNAYFQEEESDLSVAKRTLGLKFHSEECPTYTGTGDEGWTGHARAIANLEKQAQRR